MRYYVLKPTNDFRGLVHNTDEGWEALRRFDGRQTFSANWAPLELVHDDDTPGERSLPAADFPDVGLPNILVLSDRAKSVLGDLLSKNGELLPLSGDGKGYWAFNVTTVHDVVDLEASEVVYFPSNPSKIMNIKRYVLKKRGDFNAPIFKVPEMAGLDILVSDDFKRRIESAGLTGLAYQEVG